jgi:putative membrane protein insertion efficiency factor
MKRTAFLAIRAYQAISFIFPKQCKYTPSCSEYALEALKRYGFTKALRLIFFRILRCHPLAKGGYDPLN